MRINFKQNKEERTVAANFGYLSLLQVASYAFPLITMPYLARVIGTDGFGKIAFANAVLVWFQTVSDWGFTFTATRDVAQNRDNKEKVSEIFSNVLWSRFLLTFLSAVILALTIAFIPLFRENALILVISFLLIPGHILFPDWFFQAVEKMQFTTILGVSSRLIFTLLVFVFIKDSGDYYWQPLLTTIGYLICGAVAMYIILHKWGYHLYKPDLKNTLDCIKKSTNVFINNIIHNLYNSFSVLLMGFWGGSYANGIYDGAKKFFSVFFYLQQVLARAFFPYLSRRQDKFHTYEVLNNSLGILVSVILFVSAPYLVHIMLGPEFEESIAVLRILAVSFFFLELCETYGTNYLIVYHHERDQRNITLISSLLGMAVAVPLVKYYTYTGAALTMLVSRVLLGTLSFLRARKYINQ